MSLPPPPPINAEGQTVVGGHRFVVDCGETDGWQLETDNHSGPRCLACRGVWCDLCYPDIYTEQCPVASVQPLLL